MPERGRDRQIPSEQSSGWRGPGHLPPPWRGRSTWTRAAGPAGPGQRARGTPRPTSGCPARSRSPPGEHQLSPSLSTHLALFYLISLIPPRTLQGRCYYYTLWQINWGSDKCLAKGHMPCNWLRVQIQVVWRQRPTHNDPGWLQRSSFQTFGSAIYSRKCILYTNSGTRTYLEVFNVGMNIFHEATLCSTLEISSDFLFHFIPKC